MERNRKKKKKGGKKQDPISESSMLSDDKGLSLSVIHKGKFTPSKGEESTQIMVRISNTSYNITEHWQTENVPKVAPCETKMINI